LLDSGAPFYDTYKTKDGKYIAVGCIESHFYQAFLKGMGLAGKPDLPSQYDQNRWPELRKLFASLILKKTRDEWCKIFEGTDACVSKYFFSIVINEM